MSLLVEVVRRRFRTLAVVLVLLVLAGTGVGGYVYALGQWRAAQAAVKAGRLEEAQKSLDVCLFVWPRSIPVHLLAARAARQRGDFVTAETHLNRCLKLNGGASEAIQLEFLLMRAQGGEEDMVAPELLSLYVEQDSPESSLILETLVRAYLQHLRYGPAITYVNRWVEVAPDSAEPIRWRGWLREQLNDRAGAMQDYKQALERDPKLVPVRLRLGEMYLERNDPLSALPYLEGLYQQFPDRPDIRARLGQCRYMQGEMEEAKRLLESAVEQKPNESTALIYLAKLEISAGRSAKAEDWLRRALKVDPTDTEAEHLLAGSLQAQGRTEEANAMLKRRDQDRARITRINNLLREKAENPSISAADLTEIGTIFLPSNERVGRYWLNRALEREPGYQPALQALVEYYEKKGESEKAAPYRRQLKEKKEPAGPPRQG